VLGANQDVESALCLRVVSPAPAVEAVDIQRRARTDIRGPVVVVDRHFVGKFQIDGDEDKVIPDADFGIRAKDEPLKQGSRLNVPPEDELVWVPADTGPNTDLLLRDARPSTQQKDENNADAHGSGAHDVGSRQPASRSASVAFSPSCGLVPLPVTFIVLWCVAVKIINPDCPVNGSGLASDYAQRGMTSLR
jgi:hypothetical protein